MNDTQQAIYDWAFDLANLVLNPGFVFDPLDPQDPPVPIYQDQQDASAPTGLYVAIQGSPTLEAAGHPYIEQQDANGLRGVVQTYTGVVTIWEVNGNGSKLSAIREASYLESIRDALNVVQVGRESHCVTFLDTSDVSDVSFKIDNAWKMQSRMTITVSVASRITETLSTIVTAEITEV